MLRATWRSLLARKMRLLLSALSIVLGVSFVSGAFVLTDTLGHAFDSLFSTVNANVSVDVRGAQQTKDDGQGGEGARQLLPMTLLEKVRAVDGVAAAAPQIQGNAQLVDRSNKVVGTGGAPTFGFNWTGEPSLDIGTIAGRAPKGPDEIVINKSLADKAKYKVGDKAPVLTDAPLRTYEIVGIVTYPGGRGSLGGSTNVFFDTPTAQQVLNRSGVYDEITVAADKGVSQTELQKRIAAVLPADAEAITGKTATDEQSSDVKDGLAFFSTFLLVFASIALFVGAFIIANTFSMLVAQRTKELALLRALGASRRQVNRSVLLEAVVIGALASVLGLVAGVGVAKLLTWLFGTFGAEFPEGNTVIAPRTIIAAFVVGVGVTAVAAILPARRASRVAPVAALRDAENSDRSLVRRSIVGVVVLLVGAAAMAGGLTGSGLLLLGVGTLIAFLGVTLLSPLASRPVAGLVGSLFARSVPGRLGRRNAMRNPRRTSSTAAALMIGLALISAVSVLGASLKASVSAVVAGTIRSDFVLNTNDAGFNEDALVKIKAVPGVTLVSPLRGDTATIGEDSAFAIAFTAESMKSQLALSRRAGSLDLGPDVLLMSEKKAKSKHLTVGSQVPVTFAKGKRTLRLGGTYAANSLAGDYIVSGDQAPLFATSRVFAGLVSVAPGTDAEGVHKALDAAVAGYPDITVETQKEFVADGAATVDQVVQIISILLLLSIVIAILGVVNTLALSIVERTRELGLLRAVGMARRQVKRMVRVESVVIAVFGGILGLGVGAIFGVALQQALSGQGVTELSFPFGRLVIYLVVAGLAGVLAAVLPARRAARLDVLAAVAAD